MNRTVTGAFLLVATLSAGCHTTEPTGSTVPTATTATAKSPTRKPLEHVYTTATPRAVGSLNVFAEPDGTVMFQLDHPRHVGQGATATVPLVLLATRVEQDWLQVSLPLRPNGSSGWVRRSDVTTRTHRWWIQVSLAAFRLRVFHADQVKFDVSVAVATEDAPTPGGSYYLTELLRSPDPDGPYGPYAYGLSGFSDTYTSFNGGSGQLGIHGTNEPGKIGTRVSHGCIRLRNDDIVAMVHLGLPLGTPVEVLS